MTHTPGPWKAVGPIGDDDLYPLIRDDKGRTIAEVYHPDNGPIIAAAPDLLAACKRLIQWLSDEPCPFGTLEDRLNEAESAIARAEGR